MLEFMNLITGELVNYHKAVEMYRDGYDMSVVSFDGDYFHQVRNWYQDEKKSAVEIRKSFNSWYSYLYENDIECGGYAVLFDMNYQIYGDIINNLAELSGDFIGSDRECAAFILAIESAGLINYILKV